MIVLKTNSLNRAYIHFTKSLNESQKSNLATYIQAPLTDSEFFNRQKEIKALTTMFNMKPQLSIISGPVNSGKTSLLLKILKDISENHHRPVLHIDLRERSFDTVDSFASSLDREMSSWLNRFAEVANRMKLDASGYGFTLQTSLSEKPTILNSSRLIAGGLELNLQFFLLTKRVE